MLELGNFFHFWFLEGLIDKYFSCLSYHNLIKRQRARKKRPWIAYYGSQIDLVGYL